MVRMKKKSLDYRELKPGGNPQFIIEGCETLAKVFWKGTEKSEMKWRGKRRKQSFPKEKRRDRKKRKRKETEKENKNQKRSEEVAQPIKKKTMLETEELQLLFLIMLYRHTE